MVLQIILKKIIRGLISSSKANIFYIDYNFQNINLAFNYDKIHNNGLKCINYGMKCSEFKGNYITCSKFIAIDGPCKATLMNEFIISNCTTRVCNEAPNTIKTDQECQIYHHHVILLVMDVHLLNNLVKKNKNVHGLIFVINNITAVIQLKMLAILLVLTQRYKIKHVYKLKILAQCRSQTCDDLLNYITSHSLCNQLNLKCKKMELVDVLLIELLLFFFMLKEYKNVFGMKEKKDVEIIDILILTAELMLSANNK